jgi:hypothetical protein
MERNLNLLVESLQKEEVRHLKLAIQKYESDSELRKDIQLFDLIRKGTDYDDDYVHALLYPDDKSKNSFYRLRNRLMDEINKSLLTLHYNESDVNSILYNIILSRLFQQRNNFKMSYFFLRKAEKKAVDLNLPEFQDIIYSDLIKISTETLEIDPETYIQKRKENRAVLNQLNEIDDVLAVLVYRIKVSQNFNQKNYNVVNLLSTTLKQYANKETTRNNPVLKMKIYQAVSRILLQQHDYIELEKYLSITLKEFTFDKLFNKNNHEVKLQMLTYFANALFKNRKFDESLSIGEKLKSALNEFDGILKERYIFYYYNSQVNNYSVLDKHKAIQVLEEAVNDKAVHKNKFNVMFLNLQMALQYFDLKEFKPALKSIVKIKQEENFKVFDEALQIKILVFEMMVRFELEDFDFIESLLTKIKRDYRDLLKESGFLRQKLMTDILGKIIYADEQKSISIKKKINELIDSSKDTEAGDIDLVNYNIWIKEKLLNA